MATQLTTTGDQLPSQALTPEGERFMLRQRQAKMFAMSPLVPEHLRKGTVEQAIANCWIALTLAEAMGEVPLIVMQNIHVVNGKAGFASQYMIARANNSGIFRGRIDWRIDRSDANNLSVTAYAIIRETEQEVSVTCDMKMAKAEGWTKNPKYGTMPEVMLRYRSAAFLVRFYAPDVMLGYQTTEEVEDVVAAAVPAAPPLNARMLIEQSQPTPPHNPETGEIIERTAANGGAQETPAAAEPEAQPEADEEQEPTLAEETGLDSVAEQTGPHPAQAIADAIIAEINDPATNAILDVGAILNRNMLDISAMPDDLAVKIEIAADRKRAEIREAQAKTKARETAE